MNLNWLWISNYNGIITISGHANGRNLERRKYIGYTIKEAVKRYRELNGFKGKRLEIIYC